MAGKQTLISFVCNAHVTQGALNFTGPSLLKFTICLEEKFLP